MSEKELISASASVNSSTSQPQQKNNSMPGAQLAAYRRAQGKSVEEIASLLKLTPRQILALEADNYALLPGLTIVRGFIRAYAKILNVNADTLIAMMMPEFPEPVAPIVPPRTLAMPLLELRRLPALFINRRHPSLRWVMSLVVVLLMIVFFVQHGVGSVAQAFENVVTQVTNFNKEWMSFASSAASSPSSSTVNAANVGESLQLVHADALLSLNKNVVESEGSSKDLSKDSSKDSSKSSLENSLEGRSESLPKSLSGNSLILKVREDSWIEIRKIHRSATVVSRLFKAGTSETFNVDEPMFMVVGNPTGVDASLRGVPLEMKRASNSKIARIHLK